MVKKKKILGKDTECDTDKGKLEVESKTWNFLPCGQVNHFFCSKSMHIDF